MFKATRGQLKKHVPKLTDGLEARYKSVIVVVSVQAFLTERGPPQQTNTDIQLRTGAGPGNLSSSYEEIRGV